MLVLFHCPACNPCHGLLNLVLGNEPNQCEIGTSGGGILEKVIKRFGLIWKMIQPPKAKKQVNYWGTSSRQ